MCRGTYEGDDVLGTSREGKRREPGPHADHGAGAVLQEQHLGWPPPASLSRQTDTLPAGVIPPTGMRPHSVLSFQMLPQGPEQMTHRQAVRPPLSRSGARVATCQQSFSNSVTSANAPRHVLRATCCVPCGRNVPEQRGGTERKLMWPLTQRVYSPVEQHRKKNTKPK